MSLIELVDDTLTDKNTDHSYLELYEQLFLAKKNTATNILEIGIGPNGSTNKYTNGGSIKLWADYFKNATIYALDIININDVNTKIRDTPRIVLHTSTNAYDDNFVNTTFLFKNIKFDIVLDDGPIH